MANSLITAIAWAAKASLISNRSISSKSQLAFFVACRIASIGPRPINEGSSPTDAHEISFAKGLIEFFSASFNVVSNKAAAPSFIPDEFPGVTVPSFLKTVLSFSK